MISTPSSTKDYSHQPQSAPAVPVSEKPVSENQTIPNSLIASEHQPYGKWSFFFASVLLVSIPVFFQAPLVRYVPVVSLVMTFAWLGLSVTLWLRPTTRLWGDLLFGFTWTWLAGSIYWGWFRWEPFLHLPIEAIGLPFTLWGLAKRWGKVGNWFYLGSLFGTVMTDLYFYLVNLIPHWRQLMQVEPESAGLIFQRAVIQMHTPAGISWAVVLVLILLSVGIWPLQTRKIERWAFGGAVLSTILVDGLFWIAAITA